MISVNKLYKSFGEVEVLKGIDLEVSTGEVVAIIGPWKRKVNIITLFELA